MPASSVQPDLAPGTAFPTPSMIGHRRRRRIFQNRSRFRFALTKAGDSPTFVGFGVCEIVPVIPLDRVHVERLSRLQRTTLLQPKSTSTLGGLVPGAGDCALSHETGQRLTLVGAVGES